MLLCARCCLPLALVLSLSLLLPFLCVSMSLSLLLYMCLSLFGLCHALLMSLLCTLFTCCDGRSSMSTSVRRHSAEVRGKDELTDGHTYTCNMLRNDPCCCDRSGAEHTYSCMFFCDLLLLPFLVRFPPVLNRESSRIPSPRTQHHACKTLTIAAVLVAAQRISSLSSPLPPCRCSLLVTRIHASRQDWSNSRRMTHTHTTAR